MLYKENVGLLWARNPHITHLCPIIGQERPRLWPIPTIYLNFPQIFPHKLAIHLYLPLIFPAQKSMFSLRIHFLSILTQATDSHSGEYVGNSKIEILNCRSVLVTFPEWELCGENVGMGKMLREDVQKLCHCKRQVPYCVTVTGVTVSGQTCIRCGLGCMNLGPLMSPSPLGCYWLISAGSKQSLNTNSEFDPTLF